MLPTVLVTGANGFLGNHLVRELLQRGYPVRALVRNGKRSPLLTDLPIEIAAGDVTNMEDMLRAVEGCGYIIHAAALASVNPARSLAHWRVNYHGTENVVYAAQQAKVHRLVYVGTANVFGFGSLETPGNELFTYVGDRYGLDYMDSKRAATDYLVGEAQMGLPVVLVHPTFMLGPMDSKPTSGALLLELARGRVPAYPPGGKNYVHVRDVAVATVNALAMGRLGESYLLGNENLTYRAAFGLMADVLNVVPPRFALPRLLLQLYGRMSDVWAKVSHQITAFNGPMARVACDGHYVDCSKAIQELDLPQTPVRAAIQEAVEWFSQNGYLTQLYETTDSVTS